MPPSAKRQEAGPEARSASQARGFSRGPPFIRPLADERPFPKRAQHLYRALPAGVKPETLETMLACRVFGHRYRFGNEGATMRWACERGCGAGGEKEYPTAAEARRFADAFDYDERDSSGKRAPLFGLLPLRLWRMMKDRMKGSDGKQ